MSLHFNLPSAKFVIHFSMVLPLFFSLVLLLIDFSLDVIGQSTSNSWGDIGRVPVESYRNFCWVGPIGGDEGNWLYLAFIRTAKFHCDHSNAFIVLKLFRKSATMTIMSTTIMYKCWTFFCKLMLFMEFAIVLYVILNFFENKIFIVTSTLFCNMWNF